MLVSNLPLRGAFLASPLTITEAARNMDFKMRGNKPDTARFERLLGLRPNNGFYQERISLENAEKLAVAMHLDPREVGI